MSTPLGDVIPMETDAAVLPPATESPSASIVADSASPPAVEIDFSTVEANIPQPRDLVYKDECLYCFYTGFHDGGLLISLKSFLAVCPRHAELLVSHEGNRGFLNVKKVKIVNEPEEPKDKIQKLSIKLDMESETQEYQFVVYPKLSESLPIDSPALPSPIAAASRAIINHTSAAVQQRLEAGVSEWDGEKRVISPSAEDLHQLQTGHRVPYTGWRCEEPGCGLTENLWLNLSDGVIMCGRSQVIQRGADLLNLPGCGHAKLHYEKTHFPLAVKLGTVTKDGDGDVYDYSLGDAVVDPYLERHLLHFGLEVEKMEKTEQSTLEMELDLNQKWEWSRCTEDGVSLESVYGPGFTGIINIGSSCYFNSILQVLYITPDFRKVYADSAAKLLSAKPPSVISNDFNAQTAKVFAALASGDYSKADNTVENGFKPTQFRRVVGQNHVEFSTAKQQDAEEYIRYFFEKVDTLVEGPINPVDAFRFKFETRLCDGCSGAVRYSEREDVILPVIVPLDAAIEATTEGDTGQRKVISLDRCLENAFSEEVIEGFKSPVTGEVGVARTKIAFKTFPDFLVIQIKRFAMEMNGSLKKLDIDILLDEIVNLEQFAGKGPQPNETILPEDVNEQIGPFVSQEFVNMIVEMGFSETVARKAVYLTKNLNAETALDWVMNHMGDSDFESPHPDLVKKASTGDGSSGTPPENPNIETLVSFGFTSRQASYALKQTGGDVNAAAEWLFSNGDNVPDEDEPPAASQPQPPVNNPGKGFRNGQGRYRLRALISHMGSSPHSGHYVAHIRHGDTWYLFNDEKVAISQNPPISLGYLYVLERCADSGES